MGVLATDTLIYNHLSSFYLLKTDYFEKHYCYTCVGPCSWVCTGTLHTDIYIYKAAWGAVRITICAGPELSQVKYNQLLTCTQTVQHCSAWPKPILPDPKRKKP